jgi:ABC-type phosphate transport system substrate-binding protein
MEVLMPVNAILLAEYTASGNLNSIGSDTLNNLMTLWAEGFQAVYPTSKSKSKAKAHPPRLRP